MQSTVSKLLFYIFATCYLVTVNYFDLSSTNNFIIEEWLIANAVLIWMAHIIYAYLYNSPMYIGGARLNSNEHQAARVFSMIIAIVVVLVVLMYRV